jgi:predicted AlkP superfamily pyrophosphatase or phosphodiesterase
MNPKMRYGLVLFLAMVLSGCGVPAADGPADTYYIDFSLPPGSQTSGAMIFLIDGVSGEVFNQMLEAGELPAFKKYFVDRGLRVRHAIASIPSVTIPNLTSVVTGEFPGHTNINGVNWFDRNDLIWRDYATIAQKNTLDGDFIVPEIYQYFPDRLTLSLFYQPHRGATKFYEDRVTGAPPYLFGYYEFVDRLTLSRLQDAMPIARDYHQFPAVTVCYLLATDFRAYRSGITTEAYRAAMRHSDRQIGRVMSDLQRAGLLDKIHIAVVSDHGMANVTQHFALASFLRQKGLDLNKRELGDNVSFEHRFEEYGEHATVYCGTGDRYRGLYLRKPVTPGTGKDGFHNWLVHADVSDIHHFPTAKGPTDLVTLLTSQPQVDSVAYAAGDGRVRVGRRGGEVEFSQDSRNGAISYRVLSGSDPLGWNDRLGADAVSGKPLPPQRWYELTRETNYPDLPVQILAYFQAPRACDFLTFAAPLWDFGRSNHSGHGGIAREDMLTTMLIAGPGVPHKELDYARTVDLLPTLLALLGKPLPANLDGRPLVAPAHPAAP